MPVPCDCTFGIVFRDGWAKSRSRGAKTLQNQCVPSTVQRELVWFLLAANERCFVCSTATEEIRALSCQVDTDDEEDTGMQHSIKRSFSDSHIATLKEAGV